MQCPIYLQGELAIEQGSVHRRSKFAGRLFTEQVFQIYCPGLTDRVWRRQLKCLCYQILHASLIF
jgi:hypothetical protein